MRADADFGCQQVADGTMTQTLAHQHRSGWQFPDTSAEVPADQTETSDGHTLDKLPDNLRMSGNHWQPHLNRINTSTDSAAVATLAVNKEAAECSGLPPRKIAIDGRAPSAAGYSCWTGSSSCGVQQQQTLPQAGGWAVAAVAAHGSTFTSHPKNTRLVGYTEPGMLQKGPHSLQPLSRHQPEHPAMMDCSPWFISGSSLLHAQGSQEASSPCHAFVSGETPTALAALPPGLLEEVMGLGATSTPCTYHCRPHTAGRCSPHESSSKPDASARTQSSVQPVVQVHGMESPCSSDSAWSSLSHGGPGDSSCTSSNKLETYPPSNSNTSSGSPQVCYGDDSACTANLHERLQLAIQQLSTLQIGDNAQCGTVAGCSASAYGVACPVPSADTGGSIMGQQTQQGAKHLGLHSSSFAQSTSMETSTSCPPCNLSTCTFPGLLPSAPWTSGYLTRAPMLQQTVGLGWASSVTPWALPTPQDAGHSLANSISCLGTPSAAEAVDSTWTNTTPMRPVHATGSSRSSGGPAVCQLLHTVGPASVPPPPPAPQSSLYAGAYGNSMCNAVKRTRPAAAAALWASSPSQGARDCRGPATGPQTKSEHLVLDWTNRSMPGATEVAADVSSASKGTGVFVRLDTLPASSRVRQGAAPASSAVASMRRPCSVESNGVRCKGTGAFIPHAVRVAVAAAAAAQNSIQP